MANLSVKEISKDIGAYKREAVRLHTEDYQMYRDFYRGGNDILGYIKKSPRESWDHWARRKQRLVGVSYCGTIVDKLTRAEFGHQVKISVEQEKLGTAWDEIMQRNNLQTYLLMSARQRNIDGTCILFPKWDYERQHIIMTHILPEHFYPITDGGYNDMKAVIVDTSSKFNAHTRRIMLSEGAGEQWIFTPEEIGYFQDGEAIDIIPNPYRATSNPLRFVILNGKTLIGDVFGQSQIHSVALINKAINSVLNNAIELIHFQAFSLLIIQSSASLPRDEKGNPVVDASMQNFIGLDENGKAYFISPDPKIDDIINLLEKLVKIMFEVGNIPQVAVNSQSSHAESGLSRQIQFMPLVDVVEELRTFDTDSLKNLVRTCLEMKAIEETRQAPDIGGINIEWSENYLPSDDLSIVETDLAKEEAGYVLHQDNVRKWNPDKTDAEIRELIEQAKTDAQDKQKNIFADQFNRTGE